MSNKSYITYQKPKEKFILVSNKFITSFDSDVVGVYCKIIHLSDGKSLSIDFLSKKIGVSGNKVRRIIVLLEKEGYIVRDAIRNEKGYICGWNYCLYAEPVPLSIRSHAGKRDDEGNPYLPKNQHVGNPTCRKSNMLENGEVDILSNTKVLSNNNKTLDNDKKKVLSNDNTKNALFNETSEEERIYEEKMRKRFPRIMKMEQPLTLKQAKELKERYDQDLLAEIMESMENWKKLTSNNVSAYKTIIKWCEKELDKL